MTSSNLRPLGKYEPPARTPIDPNALLVELALEEHQALSDDEPAQAAGIARAQAIVRQHAGIPSTSDL